jgi:hypothetical protein
MIILVHAIGILTLGATAPINLKLINWRFFIASIRELPAMLDNDSATIKLIDMKPNFWDKLRQRLTARPTSQRYEVLFFSTAHFLFFNFMAITHLAHLLLPANTQTNPKAKAKEPNFPRFISFVS